MLHNLRHKPPFYKQRKTKFQRLPWRHDMTLCMAAACQERGQPKIAAWADTRVETGWAGADISLKYTIAARPNWRALIAGELSKGKELAATCRSILNPKEFTADNIADKLGEVSCAHKEKLTERLIRQRLGISFTRFLTKGEKELPPDVRSRTWYAIENLEFGASMIVMGFIDGVPHIYSIDEDGEVSQRENFLAIGSGCVTAQSILYFREQNTALSLEKTLYHLYEAHQVTLRSHAPGVGDAAAVAVFEPDEKNDLVVRLGLSSKLTPHLEELFKQYGPRDVAKDLPPLPEHGLVNAESAIKAMFQRLSKEGK